MSETLSFDRVDAASHPEALLAYLDRIEVQPQATELRERTYALLSEGPGVDVGCGRGKAVADLCGRGRPAVGMDLSVAMVDSARRRFPACRFLAGDATDLPFADASLADVRHAFVGPAVDAAVKLGRLATADAEAWIAGLEQDDRAGTFVLAMTMFVSTARRP